LENKVFNDKELRWN